MFATGLAADVADRLLGDPFDCVDFCLIFVPFGHYDEPEIRPYAINSICPTGADG